MQSNNIAMGGEVVEVQGNPSGEPPKGITRKPVHSKVGNHRAYCSGLISRNPKTEIIRTQPLKYEVEK